MNYCLKSLLLLAVLPLCVATISQKAAATDRFDVKVEVVQFRSLLNTNPGGYAVEYKYDFNVDIEGIGRRTIKSRIVAQPLRMTPVGRTVQFTNIKKPKRKQREIKLSAKMTGRYQVAGAYKKQRLGIAKAATSIDLFREADRSKTDTATQTVLVRNQNYMMILRVTVIETD